MNEITKGVEMTESRNLTPKEQAIADACFENKYQDHHYQKVILII